MQNTKADKSKTSVFPGLPTLNVTLILRFIFFAFIAFLILYPISMLIIGSFRTEMPGLPGSWGLRGWRELFNDPGTIRAVKNTILIAVFKTLVGIPFAILFCWLINRTNMPGRKILDTILHLNFFIVPALPVLLGWTILLDPRSGIINTSWNNAFGHILFNLNSVPGVIFVLLSTNISFYYMFLAPAFKNMDNTMEEAARVSGASGLSTMRRIVLPLLKPAILAILIMSFITGIEVFEASLLLGVDTIATQIFHLTNRMGNYMAAMSLAIVLIVVTSALVLIQRQALGNKQRTTITGKGFHPRPMNLGKWRWPALSIMIIFLGILAVPPLVMFIMTTFMKYPGVFNLPGGSWTLRNFSELFKMYPDTWQVIKNTIILALAAPTLTVIFCTLLAYISVKTKFRERKVLDFIAWIPWGIPGIALSMAMLWAWIFIKPFGIHLYGTMTLVVLVALTTGFPLGSRIMHTTISQVSSELEESARVSGASWLKSFFHIWIPLLKNGITSVWLLKYTPTVKALGAFILLMGPGTTLLAMRFYELWTQSRTSLACVVGLLQGLLIVVVYLLIKLFTRKAGVKTEESSTGW